MKIIIHDNNVHFMDFGGKNFVYPIEYSNDEIIIRTMKKAIFAYETTLFLDKANEESTVKNENKEWKTSEWVAKIGCKLYVFIRM